MDKKELFNALINAKQRFNTLYNAHPYANRGNMYDVFNQVYAGLGSMLAAFNVWLKSVKNTYFAA